MTRPPAHWLQQDRAAMIQARDEHDRAIARSILDHRIEYLDYMHKLHTPGHRETVAESNRRLEDGK